MDLIQALILGIVQGLTEFIPVSSSAHLVLVPWLLRWPEPGLAFDTVLHLGTLMAVLLFFWRDFVSLFDGWLRSLVGRGRSSDGRLAWLVLLGTIPAGIAGTTLGGWFEAMFSQPHLVAIFLLVTSLSLAVAEYLGQQRRDMPELRPLDAVVVGLAQALAIAPGISRSGATISAAMLLGTTRSAAARFSFWLAAVVIFGAGGVEVLHLLRTGEAITRLVPLTIGFLAAAGTGYASIGFLLRYLRTRGLYVFALYCAILGLAVLFLPVVR
ncbi:MAG: undecaprenyl-diphosphatase UppP [Chloroflexi bacterium]|nr:undecaprenyl-diphosphatase UppP [Chloroflexota bacterium]MCL5076100.1 undecaprenyl-diphosphatase UppP [Chloroflexota bacterium]